jgi:glycosyltransferase involved in cell wall biosynthesis
MNLPSVCAAYPDGSAGIRLAPPTPAGIADKLAEVLALPELEIRREREGASRLVSHLSWPEAERALIDFLGDDEFHRSDAPDKGMRSTPLQSTSHAR